MPRTLPPKGVPGVVLLSLVRKASSSCHAGQLWDARCACSAHVGGAQVALQHLQAACGGVALEQVEDLELAVLASQALGTQGDAKLNEARSTRVREGPGWEQGCAAQPGRD